MTTITATAVIENINEMKQLINVLLDMFEEFQNSDLRRRVNQLKDRLFAEGFSLRNNPLSDSEIDDILSLYSFYYDILVSYNHLICKKEVAYKISKSLEDKSLRSNIGWYCHHIGNGISTLIMDVGIAYAGGRGTPLDANSFKTTLSALYYIERLFDDKRNWSIHPDVLKGEVPQEVWRSHERTVAFYRAFFS